MFAYYVGLINCHRQLLPSHQIGSFEVLKNFIYIFSVLSCAYSLRSQWKTPPSVKGSVTRSKNYIQEKSKYLGIFISGPKSHRKTLSSAQEK